MKTIYFLLFLALFSNLPYSAYSQHGKIKKGIYFGPNREYQVILPDLIGQAYCTESETKDGYIYVTITDDQCQQYGIYSYGLIPYSTENWINGRDIAFTLQGNAGVNNFTQFYLDSRHGKAAIFSYSTAKPPPCKVTNQTEDDNGIAEVAESDEAIAFISIKGRMYAFRYSVSKNKHDWQNDESKGRVNERLLEFINNFSVTKQTN